MARYCKIEHRIWNSPTFQSLTDGGKFLWFYLLTSPHCNLIGYFSLRPEYIAGDMGWNIKKVTEHLDEVCSIPTSNGHKGLAVYDSARNMIWIRSYLVTHSIGNKKHLKGAQTVFDALPHSAKLLDAFNTFLSRSSNDFHNELGEYIEKSRRSDRPIDSTIEPLSIYVDVDVDVDSKGELRSPSAGQKGVPPGEGKKPPPKKYPQTPHSEILVKYHDILCPPLQPVEIWGRNEKDHLRKRWKQVADKIDSDDVITLTAWWSDFFRYIKQSKALTGQKPGFDWKADLQWIVSTKGFTRIINGRYHFDQATKTAVDLDAWIHRKGKEMDNGKQGLN
jgi:hypothetical protein